MPFLSCVKELQSAEEDEDEQDPLRKRLKKKGKKRAKKKKKLAKKSKKAFAKVKVHLIICCVLSFGFEELDKNKIAATNFYFLFLSTLSSHNRAYVQVQFLQLSA